MWARNGSKTAYTWLVKKYTWTSCREWLYWETNQEDESTTHRIREDFITHGENEGENTKMCDAVNSNQSCVSNAISLGKLGCSATPMMNRAGHYLTPQNVNVTIIWFNF